MKNGKRFILSAIGLVTGLLSDYPPPIVILGDILGYWPGIIFGVGVSLYFMVSQRKLTPLDILKFIVFIAVSTGAYYAAVFVTLRGNSETSLGFFEGGAVGAFLLLIGFNFLLSKLNIKQFMILTFLGGFLGLSWFLKSASINGNDHLQYIVLFTVWQTGMAYGLGRTIDPETRNHVPDAPLINPPALIP